MVVEVVRERERESWRSGEEEERREGASQPGTLGKVSTFSLGSVAWCPQPVQSSPPEWSA
jgi:hypothetical protein